MCRGVGGECKGSGLIGHIVFKIFIEDVKSSNGTFISGEWLSPEGLESETYELKSDDIAVSRLF